jgi:hypothetical protein
MGERRGYAGFWWRNLRERDHLENPGVDRKMDLQEVGWEAWTGLKWLRIGTGDGHL